MTRFVTTCLATTALTALPALAATDQSAEEDVPSVCERAFLPADTNKDGNIDKAEARAQRQAEFAQLDADDDGSINREEYVSCIGQAQKTAKAAAGKMQQQTDSVASWDDVETADDSLTAEEWVEMAEKAWQDSPKAAGKVFTYNEWLESEEQFARASVNRFNRQDTDNDGVLTKEEYETRARDAAWSEKAVAARFESLDSNGDDVISPQEYAGAGARAVEPGLAGVDPSTDENADSAEAKPENVAVPVYVYYVYVI